MFRRIQQVTPEPTHPSTTEDDVIEFVTSLDDESYKKLSKKFTAHRNLQKELRAIDDGDIDVDPADFIETGKE